MWLRTSHALCLAYAAAEVVNLLLPGFRGLELQATLLEKVRLCKAPCFRIDRTDLIRMSLGLLICSITRGRLRHQAM